MRPRWHGKVWLDKVMPSGSHPATSQFWMVSEGQSQDTALYYEEGSSANRNIAYVLKKGASGLELPAPKQRIRGFTPLLPCVLLTAARTGQMNRKGTKLLYSGTEVTVWLHSLSQQHRSWTSLLTHSNQTACGIKRIKISYFVIPKLLKGILTEGCTSPEERTITLGRGETDSKSSHDSAGEPARIRADLNRANSKAELPEPQETLFKSCSNTLHCLGPVRVSGSSHPMPELAHKNRTQETDTYKVSIHSNFFLTFPTPKCCRYIGVTGYLAQLSGEESC